ncbi:hypothetical protein HPG69_000188 [Diceros bicornis minor]|uniref:Uncharacterized protein n=1 Tax=Diceros bicornis minor TaxID=77932 RepID=A0A7J7EVD5_DICBM|nr:hypothetical protein HPG69_000188 [Diceros bicornis minor]
MAQTPDGISCELRGKRYPFSSIWLGGSSAAPKPEAHSALRGAGQAVLSAPPEGLAARDPLHSFLDGPKGVRPSLPPGTATMESLPAPYLSSSEGMSQGLAATPLALQKLP